MTTRPLAVAFGVLALCFGVAACGGDDNSSESTSPSGAAQSTQQKPSGMDSGGTNIVALAQSQRELSTLVTAVTAADLAKTLQGKGPYTVFAPTNQAFAAVGKKTLDGLLAPSGKKQLSSVLTYHVVPGDVMASQLKNGQTLKTVQGETLKVSIKNGVVRVGGAKVVQPDVQASNGVVHVINKVLVPQA